MMQHAIAGGGGCLLHLIEAGDPNGQAVLFLHGFSQSSLSWRRQLESDLADRYRLVAMDLRGHGLSDKPHDAYADSRLWADDIAAAIRELDLGHPILCGWSYGPLVILDYIRHYGEDAIGGIHFVDGVTRLGSERALAVLAPEFLTLVPGFCSSDADESVRSLSGLLRMCFAQEPTTADFYTMLGFNASVPPRIRQALFARAFDNDDVLATLRKPLLVTHGVADRVVRHGVVDEIAAVAPHAQRDIVAYAGHAPFWDNAAAFNKRLGAFCDEVSMASDASRQPASVGAVTGP
jgi:pimeloyl-ACP methyl ester carboxylesterase